jgi:hypothetical protein
MINLFTSRKTHQKQALSYIIYYILYIIYHILYIIYHISYIIYHILYIIYHISYIIYHISYIIYYILYIIYCIWYTVFYILYFDILQIIYPDVTQTCLMESYLYRVALIWHTFMSWQIEHETHFWMHWHLNFPTTAKTGSSEPQLQIGNNLSSMVLARWPVATCLQQRGRIVCRDQSRAQLAAPRFGFKLELCLGFLLGSVFILICKCRAGDTQTIWRGCLDSDASSLQMLFGRDNWVLKIFVMPCLLFLKKSWFFTNHVGRELRLWYVEVSIPAIFMRVISKDTPNLPFLILFPGAVKQLRRELPLTGDLCSSLETRLTFANVFWVSLSGRCQRSHVRKMVASATHF